MKNISFTDFRKQASGILDAVELGERVIVHRHGRPVAQILPYTDEAPAMPSWKRPFKPLDLPGKPLSQIIIEDRGSQDEDID